MECIFWFFLPRIFNDALNKKKLKYLTMHNNAYRPFCGETDIRFARKTDRIQLL